MPVPARADSTLGQLVYAFTYSSNQNTTARDSSTNAENVDPEGNYTGSNNGMSHYGGSLNDKGTMTVEVVKVQPDGAVVVNISEQGENIRRAPAAECVVYGNTMVICDPTKTVYTEEYTLLRFLGRNFVNPAQLDANRHWTVSQGSGGNNVHADYTINTNNNGKMQISESRSIRQSGAAASRPTSKRKIGYRLYAGSADGRGRVRDAAARQRRARNEHDDLSDDAESRL